MSSIDVMVEITVNGSGFDQPSNISIKKDGDIPNCKVVFPGGQMSKNKVLKKDLVEVYIGLGGIPDVPIFQGYLENESGKNNVSWELLGLLSKAQREVVIINDYNNYDGMELSNAIGSVISSVSGLSGINCYVKKTDPMVTVPSGKRWNKGITKYSLLKQFRDWALDTSNPLEVRRYALFSNDNATYFRKYPVIENATPLAKITYGNNLVNFEPYKKGADAINTQKVVGKNFTAEYSNAQRILMDGIIEGKPISDSELTTFAKGLGVARSEVLSRLSDPNGMVLTSHDLLNAEPNVHVVEVVGAPYGINGKYLVKSVAIDLSQNNSNVSATVMTPSDVLGTSLKSLLSIDRDFEQST